MVIFKISVVFCFTWLNECDSFYATVLLQQMFCTHVFLCVFACQSINNPKY